MRSRRNGPRVLIAPTEIAGVAEGLLHGFTSLGIPARVALSAPHSFGYAQRSDSPVLDTWSRLGAWRGRIGRRNLVLRALAKVAHHAWSWVSLLSVLRGTEYFVFLFGLTFTNTRAELLLLRLLRKKLVFIYLGSDSRPPYVDCVSTVAETPAELRRLQDRTRRRSRTVQLQERFATHCVNAAATGQFHRKPFVDWFELGFPRTLAARPASDPMAGPPSVSGRIRILHSPSDPVVKGTDEIARAVEGLRSKGYPVELVTVAGAPNSLVQQELATCDLVVDQLYSDSPMAGFATEAAHFGKPALVAGYGAPAMGEQVGERRPPTVYVRPHDLPRALEELVEDRARREELGRQAHDFVSTRWNPADVAARLLRILDDDVPESWLVSPSSLTYVHGCGTTEEAARRQVAALVNAFGAEALCLPDKPDLAQRFLELAGEPVDGAAS